MADAIESTADIFSSLIVWGGLRVSERDPDDVYPFGYRKAESLAGAVVSLMLIGAAMRLPWSRFERFGRRTIRRRLDTGHPGRGYGVEVAPIAAGGGGGAGHWQCGGEGRRLASHERRDHIGCGVRRDQHRPHRRSRLEAADDWAALFASTIIAYNGVALLRPALGDLMDRVPGMDVVRRVRVAAESTPGVLHTEKLTVRDRDDLPRHHPCAGRSSALARCRAYAERHREEPHPRGAAAGAIGAGAHGALPRGQNRCRDPELTLLRES